MSEPLITQSDDVLSGRPVFYGTRVPVQTLLDYLMHEATIDEFLGDFPTVKREQVLRFLDTARELVIAHENSAG